MTLVKRVQLPLGDMYHVIRKGKNLIGYRVNKLTGKRGYVCETNAMFIVDEYIATACLVDRECLEGRNPYFSSDEAKLYKARPASYT